MLFSKGAPKSRQRDQKAFRRRRKKSFDKVLKKSRKGEKERCINKCLQITITLRKFVPSEFPPSSTFKVFIPPDIDPSRPSKLYIFPHKPHTRLDREREKRKRGRKKRTLFAPLISSLGQSTTEAPHPGLFPPSPISRSS